MMREHRTLPAGTAARREHAAARLEHEIADNELRAAAVAPTAWQRSAHRLAAEVHADAAASHERAAARHERQATGARS